MNLGYYTSKNGFFIKNINKNSTFLRYISRKMEAYYSENNFK